MHENRDSTEQTLAAQSTGVSPERAILDECRERIAQERFPFRKLGASVSTQIVGVTDPELTQLIRKEVFQGDSESPLSNEERAELGLLLERARNLEGLDVEPAHPLYDMRVSTLDIESRTSIVNDELEFGSYPERHNIDFHIERLADDLRYVTDRYHVSEDSLSGFYLSGMLAHRLKFGTSLTTVVDSILDNYPDKHTEPGENIKVYGLSGSGKSLAAAAMKDVYGEQLIVMDSDSCRYNLIAKKLVDTEEDLESAADVLHSMTVSAMLYGALEIVSQELRYRGYNVATVSTGIGNEYDTLIFIDHRDLPVGQIQQFDIPDTVSDYLKEKKRTLPHKDFYEAVGQLFASTNSRTLVDGVPQRDNYPWKGAKTITKFESMLDVSVSVPKEIHEIKIVQAKQILGQPMPEGKNFVFIRNDAPDAETARERIARTIRENIDLG